MDWWRMDLTDIASFIFGALCAVVVLAIRIDGKLARVIQLLEFQERQRNERS
jgi:hypothetical protein